MDVPRALLISAADSRVDAPESIDVSFPGLKEFRNCVIFDRCPRRGPAGLERPGIQPHILALGEQEAGNDYHDDQGNLGFQTEVKQLLHS